MPFDRERRNRFVQGVISVMDSYLRASDSIERQWALRDGYDNVRIFNKADFPDFDDLSAKPPPIQTLSHAVNCFTAALTLSNYGKADQYFRVMHDIVVVRDKMLDS